MEKRFFCRCSWKKGEVFCMPFLCICFKARTGGDLKINLGNGFCYFLVVSVLYCIVPISMWYFILFRVWISCYLMLDQLDLCLFGYLGLVWGIFVRLFETWLREGWIVWICHDNISVVRCSNLNVWNV